MAQEACKTGDMGGGRVRISALLGGLSAAALLAGCGGSVRHRRDRHPRNHLNRDHPAMNTRTAIVGLASAIAYALGLGGCTATVDGRDLERSIEAMDTSAIAQAGSPGVTAVELSAFMDESVTLALVVVEPNFGSGSLCRVLRAYVAAAPSWSTVVRVGAVDGAGTIVDFDREAAELGLEYNRTIRGVEASWSAVEQSTATCG
jgi:hypothetical protein